MKENALKTFLEPRSVAVIGASQTPGRGGYGVVENLLNWKFDGPVFPINPAAENILGLQCYHSIASVPEAVDLAVIVVQPHLVTDAVKECAQKGVKSVVVISGGFGDSGDEGKRKERNIVDIAKQASMRIVGPNTQGIFNPFKNLVTAYMPMSFENILRGDISFVAQTGVFFTGFNLGLCKSIDLANMCDVDHAEALEYLGDDFETKVIVLHIEEIRDGTRFMDIAKRVTQKKPVIAIKTGRSPEGAKAVATHTGSLAGSDETYSAAFKHVGIIRAQHIDELRDLGRTFATLPLMKGKRIGIISYSGAAGILAADACFDHGLNVANLSENSLKALRAITPLWAQLMNPVDIWPAVLTHGAQKAYEIGIDTLFQDENVDGVLCNYITAERSAPLDITDIIKRTAKIYHKPLVLWTAGRGEDPIHIEGTVHYPSIWRAIKALSALYERYTFLEST